MRHPEVQVWFSATDVDVDSSALSRDEHARASRFRFEHDRRRWIAARVMLRQALGEYVNVSPAELTFTYSQYGKPALCGHNLHFNLSHSGDLAVCAISAVTEVGVDVERIREIEDMDALFRSISSAREYSAFRVLPRAERTRAFFETWTRKEACVKATGRGLSTPLADVDASRSPVVTLNLAPGYAAALCALEGCAIVNIASCADLRDVPVPIG